MTLLLSRSVLYTILSNLFQKVVPKQSSSYISFTVFDPRNIEQTDGSYAVVASMPCLFLSFFLSYQSMTLYIIVSCVCFDLQMYDQGHYRLAAFILEIVMACLCAC